MIFDPIESHVDGLGMVLLDGVLDYAGSAGTVSPNGSRRLCMAHVCSQPKYLMLKLSTIREKVMGQVLCEYMPGVCLVGAD